MERAPAEIKALRRKALEIEFRAKADPEYLQQLKDDPVATLRAAGFEDELAREFGAELSDTSPTQERRISQWSGDAQMRPPEHICDGITCWITSCNFWTSF